MNIGKYLPKIKLFGQRPRQITSNVPSQRFGLGEEPQSTEIPTVSVQVSGEESTAVINHETSISNNETFCRSSFANFTRAPNLRIVNK